MTNYSEAFKNINTNTVGATQRLIKAGFWKSDTSTEDKIKLCESWLKEVSFIYQIPTPNFQYDTSTQMYNVTGGGRYVASDMTIYLHKKFSLVTLLHEFRHHMQYHKSFKKFGGDLEKDARGWSCSLFKIAAPKAYQNAVDKGILHFN